MNDQHDDLLFASLIYLADSLVAEFDVIDVADRLMATCQDLLPIDEAGIMLDDQRGSLQVLVSSSEEMRLLELLQLQAHDGPCLEAFQSGELIEAPDLAASNGRWPTFSTRALEHGFHAAFAVPMRLRDRTIGALNLLKTAPGGLATSDLQTAQVLTSMATIGLMNHQAIRRQELIAEQLQGALNSRIVIEQAKGVIAERLGVDIATAFDLLRSAARSSRRQLSDVAAEVAGGALNITDFEATPPTAAVGRGRVKQPRPNPARDPRRPLL